MLVRFAQIRVRRVRVNADRITENITSGTKAFVWQDCHSLIGVSCTKRTSLTFLLY